MHALSTCGCLISLFLLTGCDSPYGPNPAVGNVKPPRTELRMVDRLPENVLEAHITYVPVYSEIYFSSGKRKLSLTATLSIHNTSPDDSLYLTRVQFFNTK